MINKLYGIVVILGKPMSRGTVRLASTNVKEPALIDLAFFRDPADMDTMLNAIACARDIAAHQGLKEWGNKPLAGQLNSSKPEVWKKWVLNNVMTTFHFCGTCAMGEGSRQTRRYFIEVERHSRFAHCRCVCYSGYSCFCTECTLDDDWLPRGGFYSGELTQASGFIRRASSWLTSFKSPDQSLPGFRVTFFRFAEIDEHFVQHVAVFLLQ